MKSKLSVFLIVSLAILCGLYGFQKKQKAVPSEEHEVTVSLVIVEVIVTKRGEFVTDLAKDEFELYEDGVKIPIDSLNLISLTERKAVSKEKKPEERTAPLAPSKKLVVLVDGINSTPRHLKRGTPKIVDELISLAQLGQEVMVIHLSPKKGVEVLQPFSTDEELIKKSMANATANIWIDESLEALKTAEVAGGKSSGEQARGEGYLGTGAVAEALSEEETKSEKQRFETCMGGILAVLNMIKDLPGRKSVLLVSDGLPDLSPKGINTSINVTGSAGEVSGNTASMDSGGRYGIFSIFDPFNILKAKKYARGGEVVEEIIRYANAQNISIYTLDPGTFTENFFAVSLESDKKEIFRQIAAKQTKIIIMQNLRRLSEDTGAAWLRGANKYDDFRQILKTDLNYYYELSYYPPRKKPDEKYHQIEVKVKHPGLDVRHRKGYADYSAEEEKQMLLLSALYNPQLYKKLPFAAEFIPFIIGLRQYRPWLNIALPVREFVAARQVAFGPKVFNLHVWVKDIKGAGSAYQAQVNIPLNIDASFREILEATEYLCFHSTGREIELGQKEYQVVFALYDDQTKEVGTCESTFSLAAPEDNPKGAIVNCVLGTLTLNPTGESQEFALAQVGGSLGVGERQFFPSITNRFQETQEVSLFIQALLPQRKDEARVDFAILKDGNVIQPIPGELVADAWKETLPVWNAVFSLNLKEVPPGDYLFRVNLYSPKEAFILSKNIKLILSAI